MKSQFDFSASWLSTLTRWILWLCHAKLCEVTCTGFQWRQSRPGTMKRHAHTLSTAGFTTTGKARGISLVVDSKTPHFILFVHATHTGHTAFCSMLLTLQGLANLGTVSHGLSYESFWQVPTSWCPRALFDLRVVILVHLINSWRRARSHPSSTLPHFRLPH